MDQIKTDRIARVLRILIMLLFIANLLAIPAVPVVIWMNHAAAGIGCLDAYHVMISAFLCFCGCCTAVILWQGRRVLDTVLRGEPFSAENAVSLRRAAWAAFAISAAALLRVIWGAWEFQSLWALLTYNGLFVPVFAMAGLLCLVMSALFRQAAEMKSENDLTI
jgi:hypothetical protein